MFSLQKFGGITRYFCDLITNLPSDMIPELPILYSENQYLRSEVFPEIKQIPFLSSFRLKRRYYYLRNNLLSNKVIKSSKFDLFHPTYFDPYFLKGLKSPFVITIHDMIHEKFPEYFKSYDRTSRNKYLLCKNAAHIITVSLNTKKDLIDIFGIHPERISVVYHGYHQNEGPAQKLYDNYILYVGERRGYKNFNSFIEAALPLLLENRNLKVVCTGHPFNDHEIEMFGHLNIANQLFHINVSNEELASLYKYASAFIYPSLYEGFGIPILEAFKNGCPICLSNTSCFPEIAGDASCFFDPFNKESIQNALEKTVYYTIYADQLRQRGKDRLKMFSVDKMVNGTCNVYKKFL